VFPEEKRDHVVETHAAISDAIIAGDADTAERLMRDHMAKLATFFEERHPGLMTEMVAWQ
jgi:DNA-binding FadR family transcriptional regulator